MGDALKNGSQDAQSSSIPAPGTCNYTEKQLVTTFSDIDLDRKPSKRRKKGGLYRLNRVPVVGKDYKPCKLYVGVSNLGKPDWFVYYYYLNPVTRKFQRFKVRHGINKISSVKERKEYGKQLIEIQNGLLADGYTPFSGEEPGERVNYDHPENIYQAISVFTKAKIKKKVAHRSMILYRQRLNYLAKWMKANGIDFLRLSEITKAHARGFMDSLSGITGRTYNNYKNDLAGFFNFFIRQYDDVVFKNPFEGVERAQVKTTGNVAYTNEQVKAIKEVMLRDHPYLWLFCEFVYQTCTRPMTEAINIKIEDIDFDNKRLRIRNTLSKEGRNEWVPLSDEYTEFLRGYTKEFPKDYYLFSRTQAPGITPMAKGTLRNWNADVKKKVGLGNEYTIYSWKHTYNCNAWQATKDIGYLMIKNRHTDISATMSYLRSLGMFVDVKEGVNAIGRL